MTEFPRLLSRWAFSEMQSKSLVPMVWITGARQVGKTWMVSKLPGNYFNWDTVETRKAFAKDPYFFRSERRLVIFDEIHKRRDWKKILKGYYDSADRRENFLVTGSGKMDQYLRGGDSLQGRYDLYHLWPITWDEFKRFRGKLASPRNWAEWEPGDPTGSDRDLIRLGGFPKPLLQGSEQRLRRWQDQYLDRLVREDTRDFSAVQRLDQLDLLARILPDRVGSPISVKSLSEDIESSTIGVKSWLRLFEVLYLGFRVHPYHRKIHRAVKKEPKWYFYQWTFVENPAARFENYLAVQLAAACSAWSEQGFGRWELFYLRDQDRREVDFLLCRDLKPQVLVEAKTSEQSWPSALHFYCKKLQVPGFLVYPGGTDKKTDVVRRVAPTGWTVPSSRFLSGLLLEKTQ
ncbi:MAG: AAA family ATPase [Pseudomonadota bacterium]